jgi:Tfp pilus assembly protein PilF
LGKAYVYPVPTIIFWFGVLILTALTRYAYARTFLRRDTTLVSFEDLSVARVDRADSSRVLTRSIVDLLYNPKPVRMSDLHMDVMPGIDEPGFGGLQPDLDMESVRGFEPSDRLVKIGSFELTLRDLIALTSYMFSRSYEAYLTGWLKESAGRVVAFASLRNSKEPQKNGTSRVERTGADSRQQAILDLAAQVLVDTRKSTLTNNWRSFRSFQEAMKLRQDKTARCQAGSIDEARAHLEDAVTYDPSNWIARFNLALTLCGDDQAQAALKHFELLEQVIRRAWPRVADPQRATSDGAHQGGAEQTCWDQPAFQDVLRHLEQYPECAFLIVYNKAVALTGLHTDEARFRASEYLEAIAGFRDPNGARAFEWPYSEIAKKLSARSRIELSLYALSAKAALLARVCTAGGRCDTEQVSQLLEKIEQLCLQEQEQHWRSLQTSRAVALTALASALISDGDLSGAHDRLQTALAAEPRLVEAHLRLAELYIRHQTACTENWARLAQSLLTQVLKLSPTCQRATALLAHLEPEPSADRLDAAARIR